MSRDYSPEFAKVLSAIRSLGLAMEEEGQIDPNQVRHLLVPKARKDVVKKLADDGLSHRDIAEALGVSHTTVGRDLAGTDVPEIGTFVPSEDMVHSKEGSFCGPSQLESLISSGQKFGCIYADPPWVYDNQGTRAATSNHYDGLTVEQLCDLPIVKLAADDAHLHLWTTNAFLFDCPAIFKAWGFEFRSSFVWVKPEIGIGNYWRNSHEFLLTGIRGNAKRFEHKGLKSWLECSRGKHSEKPHQVREFIAMASPKPRLELFARTVHDGWVSWGDEIDNDLFAHGVAAE